PVALAAGEVGMVSAGLRTAWGRLLGHAGASLEVDVGAVGTVGSSSRAMPTLRYRASWSSRYVGLGAEGAAAKTQEMLGSVFVGKVRWGEQDDWHLVTRLAGRAGLEPVVARSLAAPAATEPSGGWLSDEGWTAGAEVFGRFTRSISAKVAAEEDLTSRTLLGVRGSLGYAHPCRCISVDGFAAKRLGREGVDVWVSIDLAPR
ncbi:MAG TPA: hypothetical protein VJT73_18830, partial [Polyangiaceae bacterium]|nr:hypothetical protein [Polyangiaceae bacterium]